MRKIIVLAIYINLYMVPHITYGSGDPIGAGLQAIFSTTFRPSTTTTEQIIEDAESKEQIDNFLQKSYFSLAKEVASGCGEYVDAFYTTGEYDEKYTKDLFCMVLQKNFKVLFTNDEYSDHFLATLEDKVNSENTKLLVRWQSNPSVVVQRLATQDGCKKAGVAKQIGSAESFVVACSGGSMKFDCDFHEEIVYDTKGAPYRKIYISHLKSHEVLPACWRTDSLGVIQRLAIHNGCKDAGDIIKIKQEGASESFVIACSDGPMKFECDFYEGIVYDITTGTPYNKGHGNICMYNYYERGKTCTYQAACSKID